MSVDQRLELPTLLPALVEQGMVTFDVAQRLSTLPPVPNQHPRSEEHTSELQSQ